MMTELSHILIASHDTPGARAAERAAFALCRAGVRLSHLIVVPDFWRGMMGDDWLNNASTRETYGKHVELQLQREVQSHIDRIRQDALAQNINYEFRMMFGKPVDCLIEHSRLVEPDLVVIGAPRPKGVTGLRSRMYPEKLAGVLAAPLMIIPYPR